MTPPIRIIGGGMTGLTLGLRLAQKGLPIVVHERDPYLGGLASEAALGGVPVERYYHCVLPTDTALLALFRELGLENEVDWNRTRTGFFIDGRLIEMTTTADFFRFPALHVTDRLRLGWTIAYCGMHKDWSRFDQEPVSRFLIRHGGKRLFASIWEPLLLSKLGPEYDRFAASFIWATITRMLSARRHSDRSEKLGFVRGRYGKVFAALRKAIESAGGEVSVNSSVTSVSPSTTPDAPWEVTVNGQALPAWGVVMCAPAPVAAGWLQDSVPEAASSLRRVDYLGVVCEVLLLKRNLTPYYVLNLTDRRLPFTGVIETSNLTGTGEFNGYSLVYVPRYCGQTAASWDLSDDELHRENMAGLKRIIPQMNETDVIAWQINRARYVQPVWAVRNVRTTPELLIAPGLMYLSTAQIYPWPVFNDAVVRHVESQLDRILSEFDPRHGSFQHT